MKPAPSQTFFIRGPSPAARLTFFAFLSLVLMAADARLHYLNEIRQGLVGVMHPLQMIASTPGNLYRSAQEYFSMHDQLLQSNRQLSQQALESGSELQRLRSLEVENEHLRNLLGAAQSIRQPAQLGEILHMGRDPFVHKVLVNIGARQNVVPGQAVVDGFGVIGQVTRVYPFSSEVTLITDKELAIPVHVERNGLRAIAFGHGRDTTIDLPYLPANVDIRQGDRLVTSGIDGIYPAGLAVADVVKIDRSPDSPFAHIVCKPVAGIENHRQILLLGIPETEPPVAKVANPRTTPAPTKKTVPPTKPPHANR